MSHPVTKVSNVSLKRWACLFIATIYAISLALPAVYQHGFGAPTSGLSGAVLPGYAMVGTLPMAMLGYAWWANPLWLVGLVLLARGGTKGPTFFGLAATLLAGLVLVFGAFPPDPFEFSHFHVGYYVWLASMAALPLTALVLAPEPGTPKVPDKYQEKALLKASGRGQP
jgi:hypothetical protein